MSLVSIIMSSSGSGGIEDSGGGPSLVGVSGNISSRINFITTSQSDVGVDNATLNNGATINNGLVLDGVDDYATIPNILSNTRWAGAIMVRFTPSQNITTAQSIFLKLNSANYNSYINLGITADGKVIGGFGNKQIAPGAAKTWTAGVEHSFIMSWDGIFVYIYVDGLLYKKLSHQTVYPNGNLSPLYLGADYDYSNTYNYSKGKFTDLIVQDYHCTAAQALSYHNKTTIVPSMEDKFYPQKGVIKVTSGNVNGFTEVLANEAIVFIKSDNSIVLLYTGLNSNLNNWLVKCTAPTPTGNYTKVGPVIGPGYVGNRNAGHAWGIQLPNIWYVYATNAIQSTGYFLYSSTDEGQTWNDLGLIFSNSQIFSGFIRPNGGTLPAVNSIEFGNITIYKDLVNGYYHGILEAGTSPSRPSKWDCYYIRSTSLTSGWTIIAELTSLFFVNGGGIASPALYRVNNKWHCFYGFTGDNDLPDFTKNLPSRNSYASSTDMITWTNKQLVTGLPDMPFAEATDQTADTELFIWNGKVYMFISYVANPPESEYFGSLAIFETGKTFEQLVQDNS